MAEFEGQTQGATEGGLGAQQGAAGAGAGQMGQAGAAGNGWQMPETYRGKSVEDVARMHHELEQKFGKQGNEIGTMRQQLERWQAFGQGWDPVLKQFNYDPNRLVQALEQAAQRAEARGDHRQAAQLDAQARRWADAITPHEQEQWLEQFVGNKLTPIQQQTQQMLQQVVQEGANYINRYMDLALQVIDQKIANPKLDTRDLLQEAVNIASGRYNPIQWAAKIKTAPTEDALRESLKAELRKELDAEYKNKQMTTFVAPQGGGKRPAMPLAKVAPQTPPPVAASMAEAKAKFLKDFDRIGAGSE